MKRKHYVYRLEANGVDYGNLQAAVQDAYDDIRRHTYEDEKLSSPYVVKSVGGYKVMAFKDCGAVVSRHIDVFEPRTAPLAEVKVKIHSIRPNKAGYEPIEEENDECDFFCDECADEECEDRFLEE